MLIVLPPHNTGSPHQGARQSRARFLVALGNGIDTTTNSSIVHKAPQQLGSRQYFNFILGGNGKVCIIL